MIAVSFSHFYSFLLQSLSLVIWNIFCKSPQIVLNCYLQSTSALPTYILAPASEVYGGTLNLYSSVDVLQNYILSYITDFLCMLDIYIIKKY